MLEKHQLRFYYDIKLDSSITGDHDKRLKKQSAVTGVKIHRSLYINISMSFTVLKIMVLQWGVSSFLFLIVIIEYYIALKMYVCYFVIREAPHKYCTSASSFFM